MVFYFPSESQIFLFGMTSAVLGSNLVYHLLSVCPPAPTQDAMVCTAGAWPSLLSPARRRSATLLPLFGELELSLKMANISGEYLV